MLKIYGVDWLWLIIKGCGSQQLKGAVSNLIVIDVFVKTPRALTCGCLCAVQPP